MTPFVKVKNIMFVNDIVNQWFKLCRNDGSTNNKLGKFIILCRNQAIVFDIMTFGTQHHFKV